MFSSYMLCFVGLQLAACKVQAPNKKCRGWWMISNVMVLHEAPFKRRGKKEGAGYCIKALLCLFSIPCSSFTAAFCSLFYSSSVPSHPPSVETVYCLLSLLLWRNQQHASQECEHTHIPTHTRTYTHTEPPCALPALRVIVFGTWPLSPLCCRHTHTNHTLAPCLTPALADSSCWVRRPALTFFPSLSPSLSLFLYL